MFAVIRKVEDGYVARFERHLRHSVEKVWSALTENDKLSAWFPELSVDDLSEGGVIRFDWNGTSDELQITELKNHVVLEYTWWGDSVRFELYPEPEGCRLILERKINTVTDHTSKDIAGWHVCLDVIELLLDGKTMQFREEHWKRVYQAYVPLFQALPL